MDIVERLRRRKAFGLNGAAWIMLNEPDQDCLDAAAEIERLRALSGAVSAGDGSFREIAKDLSRSNPSKHQVD